MTASRYALRPEAGPVPLDSLNRSQCEALKATVAALSQAMKDAARSHQSREPEEGDLAIDTDRVSRLFFVSGQPGSGKTSLYVTLRAIVGTDSRYKDIRTEYREGLPDISFSDLEGQTRWLDPLDLEVAVDDEENLLAAVLVRISEAIDHSSFTASKAGRDAMEQLAELENDIGIAWDGNLKARAGFLDPDSYSQETIRTQRARLRTNRRLRSALDTLSKGSSGQELFVLPIDDFYLKPTASLDLLRLLRMISVPRLFFLMMGDIKTVEALFFEKALADWTAVAGPQVLSTLQERTRQEALPRAREMKARYLRKLIPAGQRATIDWAEWDEALKFTPPPTKDSDNDRRLGHLLSDVRICWKGGPDAEEGRNLLNYLVSPPVPKNENPKTVKNVYRETYSGLQVLDAAPREILDLWISLPRFSRRKTAGNQAPAYLRMVVECALLAIEEQDFLTEDDQEILRFVFPTSSRDDLRVRTHRLRLAPKLSPWRSTSTKDVLVRPHLDWYLGVLHREPPMTECKSGAKCHGPQETQGQDGHDGANEKWHLPPRLAAWIILLHDLAWEWRHDSLLANLIWKLRSRIADSVILIESTKDLDTAPSGWAWYRQEESDDWVHFPLPDVDTFRQLDRFLAIWKLELPSDMESVKLDTEISQQKRQLALGWAMAAWTVEKDSERRYHAYVASQQGTGGGDGEQHAKYLALLRRWYEGENKQRDEFVNNLFAGTLLLNWVGLEPK